MYAHFVYMQSRLKYLWNKYCVVCLLFFLLSFFFTSVRKLFWMNADCWMGMRLVETKTTLIQFEFSFKKNPFHWEKNKYCRMQKKSLQSIQRTSKQLSWNSITKQIPTDSCFFVLLKYFAYEQFVFRFEHSFFFLPRFVSVPTCDTGIHNSCIFSITMAFRFNTFEFWLHFSTEKKHF